jgi:hypothetical protein
MITGRVVNGHPMARRPVTFKHPETRLDVPLMDKVTGLQVTDSYFAVAVPKAGETHWNQTPWGKQIHDKAVQDWPAGEYGAADFSWKIIDGDSQVPNKKGKKPADREGWAGHWVVQCNTRFAVKCYHVGKYEPIQQIADEKEIKTGDYCRALLGVRGNGPTESPGVYINPDKFELARAGVPIVSDSGTSAADAFGGGAATTAAVVQQPAAVVQQPAAVVQPAPDLLIPQPGNAPAAPVVPVEVKYLDGNGNPFTEAQLLAAGITAEQIAAMPRA